jgi:hypothetical protein
VGRELKKERFSFWKNSRGSSIFIEILYQNYGQSQAPILVIGGVEWATRRDEMH